MRINHGKTIAKVMALGIVGEYVGRVFLTMGNYPQYVVREVYGAKQEGDE